jgi:hypothetical protein
VLAKPSIPVSRQLSAADVALTNAMGDGEILKRLTENGYTPDRINQGRKLYQAARDASGSYARLTTDQREREALAGKISKNAHQAYLSLAEAVRKIWPGEREQLLALGIHDQLPRTTAGFLAAAAVLFDAPLKDPELMDVLAELGYPKLLLVSERAKIDDLEKLVREEERSEEEIRQADQRLQQELKDLNEWMDRFIKKARVALQNKKDYLDKMGLLDRMAKGDSSKKSQGPRQAKRG